MGPSLSPAKNEPGAAHTSRPVSWSTTDCQVACGHWLGRETIDLDPAQPQRTGRARLASTTSAQTPVMIAPTVRNAIRISAVTADFEHWVANQATCSSKMTV